MFDDTAMGAGFTHNDADTSMQGETKEKSQQRLSNVMPVCIRQIHGCPNDDFSMFGIKSQIVSVVGILRDYDVSTIRASYTIEDHTGTILAIFWLESESNEKVCLPQVKEGRYVNILGSLRTQEGKKILLVLKMVPVDDPNIITTHLLEVIHARYACEKLTTEGSFINKQNNPSATLANTMSHVYDEPAQGSNFTPIQLKVHNIIRSETSINGMHIATLLSNFTSNQHAEVRKALDFLQCEGHVYTTIDVNHIKSTD